MPLPPPLWPPFSSRLSDQPPLGPSCHSFIASLPFPTGAAIDSIPTTSPVLGSVLKVPTPTSATLSGSASTAKQTTTHNAATGNGSLNSLVATAASLVILASYIHLSHSILVPPCHPAARGGRSACPRTWTTFVRCSTPFCEQRSDLPKGVKGPAHLVFHRFMSLFCPRSIHSPAHQAIPSCEWDALSIAS
ncbi:hypothetical protein BGY98DRAFT_677210 [Russula aff. rugulosa BPL654]|nr:hypothetical protein BGY98DRAFT_677210 [Russula aff. rugulosa BPL654]